MEPLFKLALVRRRSRARPRSAEHQSHPGFPLSERDEAAAHGRAAHTGRAQAHRARLRAERATNRSVGGVNLIPVAVGRDIRQVMPVAGSFAGMSDAFDRMSVEVRVSPTFRRSEQEPQLS